MYLIENRKYIHPIGFATLYQKLNVKISMNLCTMIQEQKAKKKILKWLSKIFKEYRKIRYRMKTTN